MLRAVTIQHCENRITLIRKPEKGLETLSNRALAGLDHLWVFNEPSNQRPLENPAGGLRVACQVNGTACTVSD